MTATGGIELAAVDGRKTRLKKKDQPCLNNLQKFPETKGGESTVCQDSDPSMAETFPLVPAREKGENTTEKQNKKPQ